MVTWCWWEVVCRTFGNRVLEWLDVAFASLGQRTVASLYHATTAGHVGDGNMEC